MNETFIFIGSTILNILLTVFFLLGVYYDKEFNIKITKKDLFYLSLGEFINIMILFMFKTNICAIFLSIGLSYLLISAYTDHKTMLVYTMPGYIFIITGILIESIYFGKFSFMIIFAFLLPIILGLLKAYGLGDIPMCMVLPGAIYLQSFCLESAIFLECLMIMIAEVFFVIKAIIEKNLDGPFKLKERRPLGPSILISTYIVLMIYFL